MQGPVKIMKILSIKILNSTNTIRLFLLLATFANLHCPLLTDWIPSKKNNLKKENKLVWFAVFTPHGKISDTKKIQLSSNYAFIIKKTNDKIDLNSFSLETPSLNEKIEIIDIDDAALKDENIFLQLRIDENIHFLPSFLIPNSATLDDSLFDQARTISMLTKDLIPTEDYKKPISLKDIKGLISDQKKIYKTYANETAIAAVAEKDLGVAENFLELFSSMELIDKKLYPKLNTIIAAKKAALPPVENKTDSENLDDKSSEHEDSNDTVEDEALSTSKSETAPNPDDVAAINGVDANSVDQAEVETATLPPKYTSLRDDSPEEIKPINSTESNRPETTTEEIIPLPTLTPLAPVKDPSIEIKSEPNTTPAQENLPANNNPAPNINPNQFKPEPEKSPGIEKPKDQSIRNNTENQKNLDKPVIPTNEPVVESPLPADNFKPEKTGDVELSTQDKIENKPPKEEPHRENNRPENAEEEENNDDRLTKTQIGMIVGIPGATLLTVTALTRHLLKKTALTKPIINSNISTNKSKKRKQASSNHSKKV